VLTRSTAKTAPYFFFKSLKCLSSTRGWKTDKEDQERLRRKKKIASQKNKFMERHIGVHPQGYQKFKTKGQVERVHRFLLSNNIKARFVCQINNLLPQEWHRTSYLQNI
jgi:hypothetical protein